MGEPPDTGGEGHAGGPGDDAPAPGQQLLPGGARCGRHPDIEAHATCTRCGNYMCRMCSREGQSAVCVTCLERGGGAFPFRRDDYTLDGLLSYSFARFKEHWVTLCVAALIFFGVLYGVSFGTTLVVVVVAGTTGDGSGEAMVALQVASQIVQFLLQLWLQLGLMALTLDVLEGREVNMGQLISQAHKLLGAVVISILFYVVLIVCMAPIVGTFAYLAIDAGGLDTFSGDNGFEALADLPWGVLAAGAVLCMVPFAYVMLGLTFAMPAMVHQQCGPLDAIVRAWRLASGKRLSILGTVLVSIAIAMAGALACCIGIIASVPLATLLFMGLYLALATDSA